MQPKLAAIVTGPDTYLDHLGAIAYIMNIPLFITEEDTHQAALTFYPQIDCIRKEANELDAGFLSSHFDVLFESGKFFALELSSYVKLLYNKEIRCVYCPHGHSDKGHSAQKFAEQDISLVYGRHMIDLLQSTGASNHIKQTVTTGNYRLSFYQKYRSFYDAAAHQKVFFHLDPNKKTVLYAPSWQDGENPTSFFASTGRLIEDLTPHVNLIIKLHPFLAQFHPAETCYVMEKHKNDPHVFFLERFPCIYPLLQGCDSYIGDYSSIGYDFLSFNRPLYFLIPENGHSFQLHSCGMTIPSKGNIYTFLQNTWEKNQKEKEKERQRVYEYAFGKERDFLQIKKDILEVLREKHG